MSTIIWDKDQQAYCFEADEIRGLIRPGGKLMGIGSLIHKGEDLERIGRYDHGYAPYGIQPGERLMALDPYWISARGLPVGQVKVRDFACKYRLEGDAVIAETQYSATEALRPVPGPSVPTRGRVGERSLRSTEAASQGECGVSCKVLWTVKEPNIIDMIVTLTAHRALLNKPYKTHRVVQGKSYLTGRPYRDLELWVASYMAGRRQSAPYTCVNRSGAPQFVRVEETLLTKGRQICYPRDEKAARLHYDGRWSGATGTLMGPSYFYPLRVSLNHQTGYAYVEMAQQATCTRIQNSIAEDAPGKDYTSLFTMLFGHDFKEAQQCVAHLRTCLVRMDRDFQISLRLYEEFREGTK